MATIHRTVCGDLIKVNINVARDLFNTGTILYVKGSRERFGAFCGNYWLWRGEYEFDSLVNSWLFYNKSSYGNIQFYRDATPQDYKNVRWH